MLSPADQKRLVELLEKGPERLGYETPLWTCDRVADLIAQEFEVSYHAGHVWKILRQLNWSVQRPAGRALERDEVTIQRWKAERWPAIKKSPNGKPHDCLHRRKRIEPAPHRCRTWAPRGRTPVLQYHFNWKTISVAAKMTWSNFYFQIFEKAIGKEEVVEFLMHLLQHLGGPLLIIWDRLPAHRSRLVADFVRCLEGEIEIEYLPAYAPELNPVEYLWVTRSITNCPTSVPGICGNSAKARVARCAGFVVDAL